MMRSWSETQALAERAALGAGLPFAQAARFGAASARHLAAGRDASDLSDALQQPETLLRLSLTIERAIEAASLGARTQSLQDKPVALVESYIASMPCHTQSEHHSTGLTVQILLDEPAMQNRPPRLVVPEELWALMQDLASKTYVPDSEASRERGAGAGLMDLD